MTHRLALQILAAALSTPIRATEPVVIKQLVIAYSRKSDFPGAFVSFADRLSPLLQAARRKKLRVVLYNADSEEEKKEVKKTIQQRLKNILSRDDSWLILAAHGIEHDEKGQATDTFLMFPEGFLVGELKEILDLPTNRGLFVASCHSFSEVVSKSSPIACGASHFRNTSNVRDEGTRYITSGLAEIINKTEASQVGPELKKSVEAAARKEGVPDAFRDRKGRFESVPVSFREAPPYLFQGKRFELVDEKGAPVKLCREKELIWPKVPTETFLPGSYPFLGFFSDSRIAPKPEIHDLSSDELPSLECTKDGQWVLQNPVHCQGILVPRDTCEQSRPRQPDFWRGSIQEENWNNDCRRIRELAKEIKSKGVSMPELICLTGCSDFQLFDEQRYASYAEYFRSKKHASRLQGAPAQCSAKDNGQYCHLNLTLAAGVGNTARRAECCGKTYMHSFRWKHGFCMHACYDAKKKSTVKPGDCYSSELPAAVKPNGDLIFDPDPIFKCGGLTPDVPNSECCEKIHGRMMDGKICLSRQATVQLKSFADRRWREAMKEH